MKKRKLLITGFDFPPQIGGVATYTYELAHAFSQDPELEIKVLARQIKNTQSLGEQKSNILEKITLPKIATLSLPFFSYNISRLSRNWQPDAVLAPLWFPDGASCFLANLRIPFYVSAHGLDVSEETFNFSTRIRKMILKGLKRSTLNKAKKIFPVSHYTAKNLISYQPDLASKIRVISNGVNTDKFKPRSPNEKLKLSLGLKNKFVLMTVGRLLPHKGIDKVLIALKELKNNNPNFSYLIVGRGPDRERLQDICNHYQLNEQVVFLGYKSTDEIIDLYNIADLCILNSRIEPPFVEGFGLVILEAAACGTPTIAGRSGGMPDAVDDATTGWLIDPNSPEELLKHLTYLETNRQVLEKASQACLEKASKSTWSVVANKMKGEIFADI